MPTPQPAPGPRRPNRVVENDEPVPKAAPPPEVSIEPIGRPNKWLRLLLYLIVLAVIAGGVYYWFFVRGKTGSTDSNQNKSQSSQAAQSAQLTNNTKIDTQTKHYDSTEQNLGFDYPADWSVKESDTTITATSPVLRLTDNSGQAVNGQVIFTIRQKGQSLPEFDAGSAIAVLDSQKIAYTKPTPAQRANTYVTFVRYAGSLTNSLDSVYVTGDFGYKVDQAVPKVDIGKLDPLLSITFRRCTDANCGSGSALSISPDSWQPLSGPLMDMLKSLTVS